MSPTSQRRKTRKRAMSMAGPQKPKPVLSPKSKRRSLGPPKGILKSRLNVEDTVASSFSADMTAYNIQRAMEPVNFDEDTTRRNLSAPSRRVSFAATASVRTIRDLRESNTNSTESPSSPAPSDSEEHSTSEDQIDAGKSQGTPRGSLVSVDGEQSMEIEENSFESYDGDSMDATSMFGDGIVQRRRSSVATFRPTTRSSLTPSTTTKGFLHLSRDASHPVGEPLRPPRPPSQALLDLRDAIASNFGQERAEADAYTDLGETAHRLSVTPGKGDEAVHAEDSFSTDSSNSLRDVNNDDDRTMDLTKALFPSEIDLEDRSIQHPIVTSTIHPVAQESDMSISDSVFQPVDHSRLMNASLLHQDQNFDVDMTVNTPDISLYTTESPRLLTVTETEPAILTQGEIPPLVPEQGRVPQPEGSVFNPKLSSEACELPGAGGSVNSPTKDDGRRSLSRSPSKGVASYLKPTRSTSSRVGIPVLKKSANETAIVKEGVTGGMKNRTSLPLFTSSSIRRPTGYSRTRQSMSATALVIADHHMITQTPSDKLTTEIFVGPADVNSQAHSSEIFAMSGEHNTPSPSRARRVARDQILGITNSTAEEHADVVQTPISLEEFHLMAGVRFMDEISCPRKSAIRSSIDARRESSQGAKVSGLSDYFTAISTTIPQLRIYSWVANVLRRWIDESKETYSKTEEEVARVTPALFLEYAEANDETRSEYTSFLKLVKACEQLRAKSKWFQWKRGWVTQMHDRSVDAINELENDAEVLQESNMRLSKVLPLLREQHRCMVQELEDEKQVVEEIESGDLQQLEELKDTISEQSGILEEYLTRVSEVRSTLISLRERLSDMTNQQAIVHKDMANFQGRITLQTGNTCSGVLRIRDDLEVIQRLHRLKVQAVDRGTLRLAYGKQFDVVIVCENSSAPIVQNIEILKRPQKQHLHSCLLTYSDYMVRLAYDNLSQFHRANLQTVIQILGQTWAAMSQVYSQLAFLSAQWPLSLSFLSTNTLRADVLILFRNVKSKARVSFLLDCEVLSRWPMTIRQLRYDVEVIYGKIDPEIISTAIQERLSEATAADNHACLQDACCAALAKYHQLS